MARVLALVPDLLFGSRVQGDLTAAGHEVELIGDQSVLRARLAGDGFPGGEVLIVDLTDPQLDGAAILQTLAADALLDGVHTLAFFSHVERASLQPSCSSVSESVFMFDSSPWHR